MFHSVLWDQLASEFWWRQLVKCVRRGWHCHPGLPWHQSGHQVQNSVRGYPGNLRKSRSPEMQECWKCRDLINCNANVKLWDFMLDKWIKSCPWRGEIWNRVLALSPSSGWFWQSNLLNAVIEYVISIYILQWYGYIYILYMCGCICTYIHNGKGVLRVNLPQPWWWNTSDLAFIKWK